MIVGQVGSATPADIDAAITLARKAQPRWNALTGTGRAVVLRAMADALEAQEDRLVALLSLEAGKTLNDGVAEVREAVDFCRYYAMLAERQFGAPVILDGPVGETNNLELHGRGVFACISPWNFPLAIFTGQIAAALAAGNAVLAKPAEQTPLIAAEAVRIYHKAGLDPALLALVPGDGAVVGAALVAHPGIDGVAFTGGTDTAGSINRTLAARPGPIVPFIAETGGLNGMFVDSTALREQVVDDVILSAFGSAGQRCSALRLLYLPKDTAEETIATLVGALQAQVLANPSDPSTDIGPVIDEEARECARTSMSPGSKRKPASSPASIPARLGERGSFFGPVIAEVPTPDFLEREVFGPILHIYRYDPNDLEARRGQARRARLWPDARRAQPDRPLRRGGSRGGPGRQRLCEPLDHRRGGRCPAVRRGRPVGHRPQGRRSARAAALCARTGGVGQHHRTGRRSGFAQSLSVRSLTVTGALRNRRGQGAPTARNGIEEFGVAADKMDIDLSTVLDNEHEQQVEFTGEVDGDDYEFAVQYAVLEALSGDAPDDDAVDMFNRFSDAIAEAGLRRAGPQQRSGPDRDQRERPGMSPSGRSLSASSRVTPDLFRGPSSSRAKRLRTDGCRNRSGMTKSWEF